MALLFRRVKMMSLLQYECKRIYLHFSILVFSLFLFTQNTNAQVTLYTVDDCGGGAEFC